MEKGKIKEIRKLRKEGKTYEEISREINISKTAVAYWANDKTRQKIIKRNIERFRRKPKEERRKIYEKHKKYRADYIKKRYETDKEFREKQKKRTREYWRRLRKNGNK